MRSPYPRATLSIIRKTENDLCEANASDWRFYDFDSGQQTLCGSVIYIFQKRKPKSAIKEKF